MVGCQGSLITNLRFRFRRLCGFARQIRRALASAAATPTCGIISGVERKGIIYDGYWFHERQGEELGDYFTDTLYGEIESLSLYAGAGHSH